MKLLTWQQGIRPRDRELVKAFIHREVEDFTNGRTNAPYAARAEEHLLRELEEELANMPPANTLTLNSLGNAGGVIRSLVLEPKRFAMNAWPRVSLEGNLPPSSPMDGVWVGVVQRKLSTFIE